MNEYKKRFCEKYYSHIILFYVCEKIMPNEFYFYVFNYPTYKTILVILYYIFEF